MIKFLAPFAVIGELIVAAAAIAVTLLWAGSSPVAGSQPGVVQIPPHVGLVATALGSGP